jgi:DNA polymerase elongation subunit (family B)
VFEEINRLSREVLIKTKDVVQKSGYELIYADTDSVFIKNLNGNTPTDQYKKLVSILCKETGLPISIEHDFKFLVLLPLEADEKIEALKQACNIVFTSFTKSLTSVIHRDLRNSFFRIVMSGIPNACSHNHEKMK